MAYDDNAGDGTPTPNRGKTVGRLDKVVGVRREMTRVYAEARRGEISVGDASKLANILFLIGRLLEGVDLEARLAKLEANDDQPTSWGR